MATIPQILIVDDEPNIRFVFRAALESAGFKVDEAANGLMALDRLEKSPSNMVFLDLQMTGIGGMEVLQRLRDSGKDVPVVIVTAHGSIPDAVAAMKLGAIDFLSKPLTPEALRRVVREVTARSDHVEQKPGHAEETRRPRNMLSSAKRALNHRLFDRADVLLHEAIQEEPTSPEPRYLLGVLYEVRNKPRAAVAAYQEALRIDPDYEPAKFHLMKFVAAR
jgi:DNA-binding NtrC family response regulator